MAIPSFRAAGAAAQTAASPLTVTTPAGAAAGDLLIVHYRIQPTASPTQGLLTMPLTYPWIRVPGSMLQSGNREMGLLARWAPASPAANYSFPFTGATAAGIMSAWQDVDAFAFLMSLQQLITATSTGVTIDASKAQRARGILFYQGKSLAGTYTDDAALTNRYDADSAATSNYHLRCSDEQNTATTASQISRAQVWPSNNVDAYVNYVSLLERVTTPSSYTEPVSITRDLPELDPANAVGLDNGLSLWSPVDSGGSTMTEEITDRTRDSGDTVVVRRQGGGVSIA